MHRDRTSADSAEDTGGSTDRHRKYALDRIAEFISGKPVEKHDRTDVEREYFEAMSDLGKNGDRWNREAIEEDHSCHHAGEAEDHDSLQVNLPLHPGHEKGTAYFHENSEVDDEPNEAFRDSDDFVEIVPDKSVVRRRGEKSEKQSDREPPRIGRKNGTESLSGGQSTGGICFDPSHRSERKTVS